MGVAENCLVFLQKKEWLKLNQLLSNEENCKELATDPVFSIFEKNLISEIKRHENEGNESLSTVLVRIFQLNHHSKILTLSKDCFIDLVEYLFQKHPSEQYAIILTKNKQAQDFLQKINTERITQINKTTLASNLNVKIGASGEMDFSKSIFNSPQEQELYLASKRVLQDEIIIPNIALSSIISPKIVELLNKQTKEFFFKSTLDLCIIDCSTFKPIYFVEIDSSWHDNPKQITNDQMKDEIFHKAGMKLHRIRKRKNKSMDEIFELFIKEITTNN